MNQPDKDQKRTDPQPTRRENPERTSAPPIEREHETYEGVFEEDEKRERQAPSSDVP